MDILDSKLEKELGRFPMDSQVNSGDDAIIICKFYSELATFYILEVDRFYHDEDLVMRGIEVLNIAGRNKGVYDVFSFEDINITHDKKQELHRDFDFKECKVSDLKLKTIENTDLTTFFLLRKD